MVPSDKQEIVAAGARSEIEHADELDRLGRGRPAVGGIRGDGVIVAGADLAVTVPICYSRVTDTRASPLKPKALATAGVRSMMRDSI
jgi:hypothetical protein